MALQAGRPPTHRELSIDIRIGEDDAGEFNVFVTPGAGSAAYRSVGFERFGADLVFRRGNAQVC